MFQGPSGRWLRSREPYILLQRSNAPLAGAVHLRQPHHGGMVGKTDGFPRLECREPARAADVLRFPWRRWLCSAGTSSILVGKRSPPFVQINWGRAKQSQVKFGPGGFQSSGLLLLSHFIIMNNKEILTHGFCKLFIVCTEKSGQQYVKQTTCMSVLT